MNISIIIPTYNRGNYIGLTIQSFLDQDYKKGDIEIIVCDNNSTDQTKEVVSKLAKKHNNIRYFFESRQGVHYARNSAAKISKHELLYFTDDDMIADKNLLSEMIKIFEFDKEIGAAMGRVLPHWEVTPPHWVLKHCYNYLLSLYDPPIQFQVSTELGYIYSCHQAIRRDIFFKAEGFNPENTKGVWIGDGETGLNLKVKELGYKFGYNGNSIIHHIIPASRMTQSYLNKRIGNNGFCHSYTEFRENTPTKSKQLVRSLLRTFVKGPLHSAYFFAKAIFKSDISYIRFSIAYQFYYYKRFQYDLKLVFDNRWRKFVLKRDWLTNDTIK
jgi:glucosyl-dolichyl phosphate glucuronosyltransferase